jgi:hypothetical protein
MGKLTIEEMEEMDAMADAWRESYMSYRDEKSLNDKESDHAIEGYLKSI